MRRSLIATFLRFPPWRRLALLAGLGVAAVATAQILGASEWPRTDFDRRSVDLDEITSGGPPKDGIPAVDEPRFVAPAQADAWIGPDEPVVAVTRAGEAKAYPLQILIWHEIANDTIAGLPIAVTFCPLCNSTIVFDRRAGGRVLDFGTTGRLRKSDLVMYDRQTESWWQQLTGEAIVGELTGTELTTVPAAIVAYRDFKAAYPGGQVLSRETGHDRPYGQNPYRGYDRTTDRPFLFHEEVDPRLPPMERVINVTAGEVHKIYPFRAFETEPVINDAVGGVAVVLFSKPGSRSVLDTSDIASARRVPAVTAYRRDLGGEVLEFAARDGRIVDTGTGTTWDLLGRAVDGPLAGRQLPSVTSGTHFAFAWLAFNPRTEIYGQGP